MAADSERLFMALPLPAAATEAIERWREPLAAGLTGMHWERPERMHVTLAFLGDMPPGRVPRLIAATSSALAPLRLGSARLGAPGGFPALRDPHTIWIGVECDDGWIERVQAALASALTRCGVVPDHRPFRSHVTVGRLHRGATHRERRAIGAALTRGSPPSPVTWIADRVVLYNSLLGGEAPRYVEVAAFEVL